MSIDSLQKLILPKERIKIVLKKSVIALVLLFIPIVQIYSVFVAFPLFFLPFTSSKKYMEFTFAFMFPNSTVSIAIFAVYYLAVFYLIELINLARADSFSIGKAFGKYVGRLLK